jgi:hypothetical protein
MPAKGATTQKFKPVKSDIFAKLTKNYEEWQLLMKQLESEGLELRREYSDFNDRAKINEVKNKIKD